MRSGGHCHNRWRVSNGNTHLSHINYSHDLCPQVRYAGFRGITAGLQSDTYIEAMKIEKVKQNYENIHIDQAAQEQMDEIVTSTDAYSRLACSIGD